jgi:hypothetical protein
MHIRFQKIKLFFRFFSLSYNNCRREVGEIMRILSNLKNGLGFACVLALPIGVYQGNPDSTNASLGVYGGTGRFAAFIQSCEGESRTTANNFSEYGGAAYLAVPPGTNSPLVVGLRGGHFRSNLELASFGNSTKRAEYTFDYLNPSVSLEFSRFGIGVGYVSENVPIHFGGSIETGPRFSSHLRVNIYRGSYLLSSFNEDMPLVSGGGSFNLGFGFPAGNVFLFNGLSAGQYHNAGVLHQGRIRLSRGVLFDASFRWGWTRGIFEGGGAVGLVYQFGRPYTKTVTKPVDW